MNQRRYITQRIIDACLREDVAGVLSRATLRREGDTHWLYASHFAVPLRLAVSPHDYMQSWRATAPRWQEYHDGEWRDCEGYDAWLARLTPPDDPEAQQLYHAYRAEADAACAQGELCRAIFAEQAAALTPDLARCSWGERLRHADRMASFLDHPYYPTARAKFGFDAAQLRRYAPEFAQPFALRWLAVPRDAVTLCSEQPRPAWWPRPAQVGLPPQIACDHVLLPVHPLTWPQLNALPPDFLPAPDPYLEVYPTLSVRTLQLAEHPDCHLKVPLAMRTLGQKNLRLIKPSTLYDGQWFADVLPRLAQRDPLLRGRLRHVDESDGGHVGDEMLLAFLLRRYPAPRADETLAPVAALGSPMPDGGSYLAFVLRQPNMPTLYQWWQSYCTLMAEVHLTLWLRYGIALESNQQNAMLSLAPGQPLTLVLKDNDAARLWPARFCAACPDLAPRLAQLRDPRICVDDERALAQMFITITLQLDLAAVLESLAAAGELNRAAAYHILRQALANTLATLAQRGVDTAFAQRCLFEDPHQPVKYLLQSGSLLSKQASGAADINKFYGHSGPNFLRAETS
ncbi:IucA/IucC family protein [Edwardsiella piscicida]|uniref:IucA/IucC family protein n=1 Tax=Edwardsiella piscicida TaxID=1263550 RepID=UPI00370DA467